MMAVQSTPFHRRNPPEPEIYFSKGVRIEKVGSVNAVADAVGTFAGGLDGGRTRYRYPNN
ncbi:MAG TPA: hypothetical protein PLM24_06390 [Methanothrix sp.]|nr:hypothetical protein [Methanothrix sp.]